MPIGKQTFLVVGNKKDIGIFKGIYNHQGLIEMTATRQ